MMPMKEASREINSAASAKNETTRLSALATGLRLMMTAAPKTSIIKAKIQNKNGDMTFNFEFGESLLFVPFQNDSVHNPADLEQFVFVMHHVFACESGDGVIFSQINRLFGADFLAHPAKNAAHHIDIEFFRVFFHLGETIVL